jgi:hypothetical protein
MIRQYKGTPVMLTNEIKQYKHQNGAKQGKKIRIRSPPIKKPREMRLKIQENSKYNLFKTRIELELMHILIWVKEHTD